MKKFGWFFITIATLCLISAFVFCFKSTSTESSKIDEIKKRGYIKVGIKVDVPGFGFLNPDSNREEGFEPDLARAIAFKIFGSENAVRFRPITPKTRGSLLDNDELDFVTATFTITEKRKQSYSFTLPYFVDHITFLVNKNSGYKSIIDLSGKTIGVSQSTPTKTCLQEKAKELGINLNFAEYTSYHELKTALETDRIDALSADKSIIMGYMDENDIILDDVICEQEYAATCKLKNKDLCDYLNEIIDELKTDGTIDALMKKWNLK